MGGKKYKAMEFLRNRFLFSPSNHSHQIQIHKALHQSHSSFKRDTTLHPSLQTPPQFSTTSPPLQIPTPAQWVPQSHLHPATPPPPRPPSTPTPKATPHPLANPNLHPSSPPSRTLSSQNRKRLAPDASPTRHQLKNKLVSSMLRLSM